MGEGKSEVAVKPMGNMHAVKTKGKWGGEINKERRGRTFVTVLETAILGREGAGGRAGEGGALVGCLPAFGRREDF